MRDRRERIRFDHCPACGETEVRNILRRAPLRSLEVFVECTHCDRFVAKYEVHRYTSNKSYEDILGRLSLRQGGESARGIIRTLVGFDRRVAQEFELCRQMVRKKGDPKKIEEILSEEEQADRERQQGT